MAKKRKKRKVNIVRLGLLIACVVLIIVLILTLVVLGFKKLTNKDSGEKNTNEIEKTTEVVTKESLSEEMQARVDAYMANNPDVSEEQAIKNVKMNLDLQPYENVTIVEDDSNMALLINKFYALPEGYVPSDLVNIEEHACVQGADYSCQDVDVIQLRSEVYEAYLKWCNAATEQGLDIRAIAGYRSYEYQSGLWSYNAGMYGEEYADEYYARPGQSEHNSGLCVDITFNDNNFNEIELHEGYDWILSNAHKFGFILRYPEEKVGITMYNYESWHFRYVGVDIATQCYENNWCLEEYWAEQ